jgi:hypothetical protein
MTTARKYIKFGLRADKNLADLTDPGQAVDNLLDDQAIGSNKLGEAFTFSSIDILPLRSFAGLDLKDTIDPSNELPKALTDLEGSIPQYNADIAGNGIDTGIQDIVPQVTLQDYINRFKVVLGDPPFAAGGSGPFITYVDPNRITDFIGDSVNFQFVIKPTTDPKFDLRVGNKYKIVFKGNITDAQWDAIALVDEGTYANGDIFVCDQNVATVVGSDTTAIVLDITNPSGQYAQSGQSLGADDLHTDFVYTNINANIGSVIETEDDFPDSKDYNENSPLASEVLGITGRPLFYYQNGIHPEIPGENGLIQFEGYQYNGLTPHIGTNGYFIVEEDIVDDGTENNWQYLAGTTRRVNQPNYNVTYETLTKLQYENIGEEDQPEINKDVTVITYSNEDDWKRIACYMECSITGGSETGVVYRSYVTDAGFVVELDRDLGVTNTTGTKNVSVSFTPGDTGTVVVYKNFSITRPLGEERTRVRYTFIWPNGTQSGDRLIDESSGDDVADGRFEKYSFFKTQLDPEFVEQRFSFPYFRENRAQILNQQGDTLVKVNTRWSNSYQKSGAAKNVLQSGSVFPDISGADSNVISEVSVYAESNNGILCPNYLTAGANPLENAEIGDWIVTYRNGNFYTFQIKETYQKYYRNTNVTAKRAVVVSENYLVLTGHAVNSVHKAVIVKNNGLIGIFKHDSNGISRTGEGLTASYPFKIQNDMLLYKVEGAEFSTSTGGSGFDTHKYAFRVTGTSHNNNRVQATSTISVQNNPDAPAGEQTLTTTEGFVAIYASKGLMDFSTIEECTNVFGIEAAANGGVGDTSIVLKDVLGIKSPVVDGSNTSDLGDFVYFDGSIPYDNSSLGKMTKVKSLNTTTNTIELENEDGDVQLTALLPLGSTVVFVPQDAGPNSDGWGRENKEYCVIPLNTAPPWEGTDNGLASPALTVDRDFGVMAKELRFVDLSFDMPAENIKKYDSSDPSTSSKYLNISYVDPVT